MSTEVLIAFVVKLTVVLALAWMCTATMRRASAAARHQVWASAVIAVLVLPVFVWNVPVWRVVVATRTERVDAPKAIEREEVAPAGPVVVAEVPRSSPQGFTIAPMDVVIAIWAAGALLLLARLMWGLMRLHQLRGAARLVERQPDGVYLFESASASSTPMAWGWPKPCVLLPAGFREWDGERLRVVLAHELAHVRRRDWIVQVAAQIAKCMYWFHPLAWLAATSVREESERAADDAVLRAGVDGPAYAQHLLEVARAHQDGLEPALAITGSSPIERRLGALLDRRVRRSAVSRRVVGMSFAASVAMLVPFAAFSPAQEVERVVVAQDLPRPTEPPAPKALEGTSKTPTFNQADRDYVLGPNDQIVIRSSAEEINRTYTVDREGNVNLPLMNQVPVSGLTVGDLERNLSERLATFLVAPVVSIAVVRPRSEPAAVAAPAKPLAFEVVSIRPNPGPWHVLRGYSMAGPMVTLEAYNIQWLATEAFGIEDYQFVSGANVSRDATEGTKFYNISAKAPGDVVPTRAQVREMLQEMLVSRFGMKFHWESRDTPVYALAVGKGGIKFRESKPDTEKSGRGTVEGRIQTMHRTAATMADLARDLRSYVDRPVVDKTGLSGNYDYEVGATIYFRLERNRQPEDVDVVDAIDDMLGLRLEKVREQMPVLVVDGVDGPSEN